MLDIQQHFIGSVAICQGESDDFSASLHIFHTAVTQEDILKKISALFWKKIGSPSGFSVGQICQPIPVFLIHTSRFHLLSLMYYLISPALHHTGRRGRRPLHSAFSSGRRGTALAVDEVSIHHSSISPHPAGAFVIARVTKTKKRTKPFSFHIVVKTYFASFA